MRDDRRPPTGHRGRRALTRSGALRCRRRHAEVVIDRREQRTALRAAVRRRRHGRSVALLRESPARRRAAAAIGDGLRPPWRTTGGGRPSSPRPVPNGCGHAAGSDDESAEQLESAARQPVPHRCSVRCPPPVDPGRARDGSRGRSVVREEPADEKVTLRGAGGRQDGRRPDAGSIRNGWCGSRVGLLIRHEH
ncbi:hypothetical protein HBB16_04120 [Pseudonocardia sp. MCCB 268]|nr:hypothetical protein [Pseudonocardia cytotoxica]